MPSLPKRILGPRVLTYLVRRELLRRLDDPARYRYYLDYLRRAGDAHKAVLACWRWQTRTGRGGTWGEVKIMPHALESAVANGLLLEGAGQTYLVPPPEVDQALVRAVNDYQLECRRYWRAQAAERARRNLALATQAARQRLAAEAERRAQEEAARERGERVRTWTEGSPVEVFARFGATDAVIENLVRRGFRQRELVKFGRVGSHRVSRIFQATGLARHRGPTPNQSTLGTI